ncbi:hypothetical protein QBC35DRAFT_357998, partial [Podospora australis]
MPILASLLGQLLGAKPPQPPSTNGDNMPTPAPPSAPVPPNAADPPVSPVPAAAASSTVERKVYQRPPYPPVFSERSRKQLGLFFGGCGFLALSVLVSRRAIAKHVRLARPRYFDSNVLWTLDAKKKDGPLKKDPFVAAEALALATLHVMSFGILFTGGMSWAWNISSLDELRALSASRIRQSSGGVADEEAEKELTEWVAKTLGME